MEGEFHRDAPAEGPAVQEPLQLNQEESEGLQRSGGQTDAAVAGGNQLEIMGDQLTHLINQMQMLVEAQNQTGGKQSKVRIST